MNNTKHYAFRVYGANEYICGRISGIMACMCEDDPSQKVGYPVAAVVEQNEEGELIRICSYTMAVDTTPDRFSEFIECVMKLYSKLDGFKIKMVYDY